MEIDQDFLPFIFTDDIIYLVADQVGIKESNQISKEGPLETETIPTNEDVEVIPLPAKSSEVKEDQTTYKAPKVLVLLAKTTIEKEETLLNNILKAVNLTSADVERIYEHPSKFNELRGTKLLLSFHSNYAPSVDYEINVINGIQVIYAHDLGTLEGNINYKKQLWGNLKQIKS